MEPIEITLETILKSHDLPENELDTILYNLNQLINKLCKFKIRHNDLHWGNLAILHGNLVCIDCNEASIEHQSCFDYIEWFQLARTVPKGQNKKYLFEKISQKLNESLEIKNIPQITNEEELNMAFVNKFIQPMCPQLEEKAELNFEFLNKYQCEN